jgi:hemerythrin
MPLIEWTAKLSVGIDSIDEQHKKLVNMINALNYAMLTNSSNELLGKIFTGLAAYTQKHFTYEENMFAEYGYTDSEEHKRQHNELIAQVVELKQKFIENPQGTMSADLMLFLKR